MGYTALQQNPIKRETRSWVRISAFAAFVTFTLVSVIEWSFRWILLAVILLIWTIIGGVSLICKKGYEKEYKAGRIVFKAITMLLIVFIAVTPALIFPQYGLPKMTGEYEVDTVVYTYTDDSRIETFNANNGVYDDETVYKLEKKWMKVRTEDMNFVLDTIIKNAKDDDSDKVYQLIDTDKIGLFGHSLGGAASAQLGRERSDIDAVINLDGDLLGIRLDKKNQ